ncbi:conserved hypothetical protein [Rhodopseudomonas palustris TIE-1]|uniref:DUF2254 domain-containing protein n=1 Tax=Rhodopseudomonas palustris TaxID=1076 RepID=UPI000164B4AE|nr:DUF2254 domain-containing protein [Rhodopseudomonas palustris]ACF02321.1 conserved hypothetical protein [Rhodopseudomonas palustris TIE-1]
MTSTASKARSFLSAAQLLSSWDRARSSFWFLPTVMAALAIGLSFGLIEVDNWLGSGTVGDIEYLYLFGPEGARAILSTIASSMITVAGLTFSITMLTLQLASSQFGPRLLRNFMRDRGNQLVLGTFISTFVYCLLVLRTVRGVEGSSFVPHLAVAFGVLMALASLGVLIYFIHHIASSIRIESLLTELASETRATIARMYPERLGRDAKETPEIFAQPSDFDVSSAPVTATRSGYLQRIDVDMLMQLATENDLVLRVEAPPGRFVIGNDAILRMHPKSRGTDEIISRLRSSFIIGEERTPDQDLHFSVRRIVEIAQRALSPGVNDPTTALYCIDRLREIFVLLAGRDLPSAQRVDKDGNLRVVTDVVTLDTLAGDTFSAVAHYGIEDSDVVQHLIYAIESVTNLGSSADNCEALRRLGGLLRSRREYQLARPFD